MATAYAPERVDGELGLIVRTLADEFERSVFGATSEWRRSAHLLAIILFGAHADGKPRTLGPGGMVVDRQILVVVSDERLTDVHRYWLGAEQRLERAHAILGHLSVPTTLLVRSTKHVNGQLEKGRPFFMNIMQAGVRLYEAPGCTFSPPRRRGRSAAMEEARAHFAEWMGAAERRMKTFAVEMAQARRDPVWRRDAAFTLHQAVERLYGGVLLSHEGYMPSVHQLGILRALAEQVDPRLVEAWPRDTKKQRRAFELLRQAYIRGRYAPDFRIAQSELDWLAERVEVLRRLVREVCDAFFLGGSGNAAVDVCPAEEPASSPEAVRGG